MKTPFNKPFATGHEFANIQEAINNLHLSGDGQFTRRCNAWLEQRLGVPKVLLTHSCTAALEMSALLAEVGPGDEVILPSFTFVSTANAFALRGATPVFVDIRPDTLNIDERLIEAAISPRTRAICVVHYAGVACEMDAILKIAKVHQLLLIEDAAQGMMASYRGRALGTLGEIGALSFHETKNIISGEGGALLLRDERFHGRAEIVREKGTNRSAFFRGAVDKYTWVDVGSSYLPSEIVAAFLWAQLEDAERITRARLDTWDLYFKAFAAAEDKQLLTRPVVPAHCAHNGHMFYVLTRSLADRTRLIAHLAQNEVNAVFHYVPLHSSPAGRRLGRVSGTMATTDSVGDRLVRLPLWIGLPATEVERIAGLVEKLLGNL
jgi:dTDP-4-amino-4,6-dideoxygalactose transaminase